MLKLRGLTWQLHLLGSGLRGWLSCSGASLGAFFFFFFFLFVLPPPTP